MGENAIPMPVSGRFIPKRKTQLCARSLESPVFVSIYGICHFGDPETGAEDAGRCMDTGAKTSGLFTSGVRTAKARDSRRRSCAASTAASRTSTT